MFFYVNILGYFLLHLTTFPLVFLPKKYTLTLSGQRVGWYEIM